MGRGKVQYRGLSIPFGHAQGSVEITEIVVQWEIEVRGGRPTL